MSEAKKLPSGKWRNLLYVGKDENGKRIYESFTADTKKEANLLAMARARELEQGIRKDRTPSELTVGEAIDRYIEDRDSVLAPKTIREYKRYRKLYAPQLMRIKLKNLTAADIQKALNTEAKSLSPKSIRNLWSIIQSGIHYAVPGMDFTPNLPQKVKTKFEIPTHEQLLLLFDTVKGTRMEIPVILAATCGLRRGEIAALDLHSDVDYKNNRLTVSKAITNTDSGEWVVKSPKAYSSYRTLDVPEWVIGILREAKDNGYKNMNAGHITSAFTRIRDKLGLNIRFHDLRHYYASVMLSLGIPDKYAMQRMGHATPNMLKNVYQHIITSKDEEVSQTITRYFSSMQHDMQHDTLQHEEKDK
jgi:integrase